MGICKSRFKVYLLQSIIDLLEKKNTEPCFIFYDDNGQSKLHIRFHNNVKNYFDTDIPNKFENWTKNPKYMGKYVKHIKIAKNLIKGSLTATVVF